MYVRQHQLGGSKSYASDYREIIELLKAVGAR